MVAQEAIDFLARPFWKMFASSNRCTLDFPLEIMLTIATHLNDCALASLALTCRNLHNLWDSRTLSLQPASKEKLLLLLEKDITFLYYRYYCTKLHRWHTRWTRSIVPYYEERLPCKRSLENHIFVGATCHIPYHHARLIMNRHLYGPKHGLPLHMLNERDRSYEYRREIKYSKSQHARIFNNQLLVLTTISMRHRRGDAEELRRYIDNLGQEVCRHLAINRGCPTFVPVQLPPLEKKGNAPGQFLAGGPTFGSCSSCPTDYGVSIQWQGTKKGYYIEILIYRGLGDCRSPFSWQWRTMTTLNSGKGLRSEYLQYHRPGSIREQWNRAGSVTTS